MDETDVPYRSAIVSCLVHLRKNHQVSHHIIYIINNVQIDLKQIRLLRTFGNHCSGLEQPASRTFQAVPPVFERPDMIKHFQVFHRFP